MDEERLKYRDGITFDFKMLKALRDMFGGEDALISLQHEKSGPMGEGVYAYFSEYPEEGYAYLGSIHTKE